MSKTKVRPDCRKLMADIAETYLAGMKEIRKYWEESGEKKTTYNGMERIMAAEPPEKRLDTVRELKGKYYAKVNALRSAWDAGEAEYFSLHGEDLTDDAKLLNDALNPTIDQLVDVYKRYVGKNWTMENAIRQFCLNKDKYKALLALPRTQGREERAEIVELYDGRIMRPMFTRTADNVNNGLSAFDYEAGYKLYLEKFQEKILDMVNDTNL